MNHSNMYAVGLALCTFANIASEEMSRDLANEIEKLLGSSNTYIRKKVYSLIVTIVLDSLSVRPPFVLCELSKRFPIFLITLPQKQKISLQTGIMVSCLRRSLS